MRLFTKIFSIYLGLLLVAGTAFAQFETDWERANRDDADQPAPAWFGTGTERSVAYGIVGGQERLYVPSRSGEAYTLRVLDPDTGEDLDVDISTAGIEGGAVEFNTVAVSDDGKIFVANLTTTSSETQPYKVYMWTDEEAEPEVVVQYGDGGYRLGDHLDVIGSVEDGTAVISIATGNAPNALRWHMVEDSENAGKFVFTDTPAVHTALAGMPSSWGTPAWSVGKEPGVDGGFFSGARSATFYRQFDADGAPLGFVEVPGNRNMGAAEYVSIEGEDYIAAYHPTIRNARLHKMDGTPGGQSTNLTGTDVGLTPVIGPTTENTYGDVSVRVNRSEGTVTLFVLGTNNGIGSYTSHAFFEPEVPAEPFEPIAFWHQNDNELSGGGFGFEEGSFPQHADVGSGSITLGGGDVLATNDSGVYSWVQSFGGSALNAPNGVESGGSLAIQGGTGTVNNGAWLQIELNTVGYEDVVLSYATQRTGSGFNNNQVSYSTDGTNFTDLGAPYDPPTSYDVLSFDFGDALNHAETAYIRITLDGASGESGNNRFDNITVTGTEAEPPAPIDPPGVLEDPVWVINAGDAPWFAADNSVRGGDYNPVTDNLLIPSRTGGAQVQILHPATGESLGVLDLTGVEGGTFPINEVSVTFDGQIFVANLAQAGEDLKIYRWTSQDGAPELVYEGQPAEATRYGDALHASADGDDVLVFVSGSGTENIAMIRLSDGESTVEIIELDDDIARQGIFRVPGEDSLWVSGTGTALTKISFDGTVGREIADDVVAHVYGDIYHFIWHDRSYILTGPEFLTDHRFVVVDVTDAGQERVVYETIGLGGEANANAVGFVTADWKRGNLIVGATNNAIAAFSLEERENTAPFAGGIARPLHNATLVVEGDGDQVMEVIWRHGIDPEGDPVLHTWQLSTSSSFDTIAFEEETMSDTTTAVSYQDLAAFLDDQNVEPGASLQVYHRVVVSDGELTAISAASNLTLTRGTLTNVDPWSTLPTEFALQGNYPNPFNPTTNIRFDLPEAADVRVEIYDVLGRRVMEMRMDGVQAGADQNIRVDASSLASGTYLYRVVAETANGVHEGTRKMVLVK